MKRTDLTTRSLMDVSNVLPADEEVLAWDAATGQYVPTEVSGLVTIPDVDLTDIVIDDHTANAFRVREASNNYIHVNTTNGSEAVNLGNTGTNPVFHLLGTGRIAKTGNRVFGDYSVVPSGTNVTAIGSKSAGTFGANNQIVIGTTSGNLSGNGTVILAANGMSGQAGSGSLSIIPDNGAGAIGTHSMVIGSQATATQNYAIAIGYATSSASSASGIAIGNGASTSGTGLLGLGYYASASGAQALAIGYSAAAAGTDGIAIGQSASAGHQNTVVLGRGAASTGSSQFVVGGNGQPITDFYLGEGVGDASPPALVHFRATGGSGANVAGSNLIMVPGIATGNALSGYFAVHTAPAGSSGSGQQIPTERLRIDGTGQWLVGGGAGTSGQVLTSNGAGAAPTWQDATGGGFDPEDIEIAASSITALNVHVADTPWFQIDTDAGTIVLGNDVDNPDVEISSDGYFLVKDRFLVDSNFTVSALPLLLGRGEYAATPQGGELRVERGSGTDVDGADLDVYAGSGTGDGTPGELRLHTSTPTTAGTTEQTFRPTLTVTNDRKLTRTHGGEETTRLRHESINEATWYAEHQDEWDATEDPTPPAPTYVGSIDFEEDFTGTVRARFHGLNHYVYYDDGDAEYALAVMGAEMDLYAIVADGSPTLYRCPETPLTIDSVDYYILPRSDEQYDAITSQTGAGSFLLARSNAAGSIDIYALGGSGTIGENEITGNVLVDARWHSLAFIGGLPDPEPDEDVILAQDWDLFYDSKDANASTHVWPAAIHPGSAGAYELVHAGDSGNRPSYTFDTSALDETATGITADRVDKAIRLDVSSNTTSGFAGASASQDWTSFYSEGTDNLRISMLIYIGSVTNGRRVFAAEDTTTEYWRISCTTSNRFTYAARSDADGGVSSFTVANNTYQTPGWYLIEWVFRGRYWDLYQNGTAILSNSDRTNNYRPTVASVRTCLLGSASGTVSEDCGILFCGIKGLGSAGTYSLSEHQAFAEALGLYTP